MVMGLGVCTSWTRGDTEWLDGLEGIFHIKLLRRR